MLFRFAGVTTVIAMAVFPMSAPAAPAFRPLPLTTADQQAAMNAYGNLAISDIITTRCGKAFLPPVTEYQKASLVKQAALARQGAQNALHDAYPLEKPESFLPYLDAYRDQEAKAANGAIDTGGCDDARVQVMITLLSTYLHPVP